MLDQLSAQGDHGPVFLDAVAVGHHDRGRHPVGAGGESDALAVVASCRRDNPGFGLAGALEVLHINQAAAHLEGADRRVVLVFDPDLAAGTLAQQRPAYLRRRRDIFVNHFGGGIELGAGRVGHGCYFAVLR